jgi:hypothetical protein
MRDTPLARSSRRQHSAEITAAEDVYVKMWHLLVSRRPIIGDNPKAAFGDTSLTRDVSDGADQSGELSLGPISSEIVERDIFPFRDHQHMRRRSRGDVIKRQDILILVDFIARNIATQDAGEDIVAIIVHSFAPFDVL